MIRGSISAHGAAALSVRPEADPFRIFQCEHPAAGFSAADFTSESGAAAVIRGISRWL